MKYIQNDLAAVKRVMDEFPDRVYALPNSLKVTDQAMRIWGGLPLEVRNFFNVIGEVGFDSGGGIGGEIKHISEHGYFRKVCAINGCFKDSIVVGYDEPNVFLLDAVGTTWGVNIISGKFEDLNNILACIIDYVDE